MNENQRTQVARIISHSSALSRAVLAQRIAGVETEFARAGRLGSGAMASATVEQVDRTTDLMITELVAKIAPVARSPDAFAEIESAARQFLRSCKGNLEELRRTARSLRLQERGGSQFLEIAQREMTKVTEAVERRLEIERYDFSIRPPEQEKPHLSKAKGGRPPAEFWDDMWAAIATGLYCGDLKPRSQSDIQRAMAEWIEGKGHSAADSTVKARARRLWNLIDQLDQ